MISASEQAPATSDIPSALLARVRAEFLEMPGLRLTPWQASRLWGLEVEQTTDVLTTLVRSGFLWRNHDGAYLRRSMR